MRVTSTIILCTVLVILSPLSLAQAEGQQGSCAHSLAADFAGHEALLPPENNNSNQPKTSESNLSEQVTKVETIWLSGKANNRLDIVFLGDGYTASEEGVFRSHVQLAVDAFFNEEPFKSFKNLINIHIVFVSSNQSGVDNDPTNGVESDTELDMRFWCFGSQRGLCVDIDKAKAQAELAPAADQIIVAANSTSYGGIGYTSNDVATFSGGNILARELLLHEFGHSFGDLADEYDGAGNSYQGEERSKANVSILSKEEMAQDGSKWANWLDHDPGELYGGMISTYEGAELFSEGIYRPSFNSKMRSLGQPFNMPSIEALVIEIYKYVSPIDQASHSNGVVDFLETIYVDPVDPLDHSVQIEWFIDGVLVEDYNDWFFSLREFLLSPGIHTITARVVEMTDFVRDQGSRDSFLTDTLSWEVDVPQNSANSDLDNDGYTASEEAAAGTDPFETSSMPSNGSYQLCSFPNGFLEQVNILNLVNEGVEDLYTEVSYFAANGAVAGSNTYLVEAGKKLDVSLFDLGLKSNTIGTVCATTASNKLSGGLSVYAPDGSGGFDFALYYPLERYVSGESSSLSINTFNLVPGEPSAHNWIRIVDGLIGDGIGLSGEAKFYDFQGVLVEEISLSLKDGERIDLSGHDVLGGNVYGLVKFVPDSSTMKYFIEVTRYFPKLAGGFYSAVPLSRLATTLKPGSAITEVNPELQDIIEITNSGDSEAEVFFLLRNSAGQAAKTEIITVPAKGSFHRIVSEYDLQLEEQGGVTIVSESKDVKSHLLSYRFDSANKFFSGSSLGFSSDMFKDGMGQFNTYLDQTNCLSIHNSSSDSTSVEVSIENYLGVEIASYSLELAGKSTQKIDLDVPANTYGSIKLSSDNAIFAQTETEKAGEFVILLPTLN